MSDRYLSLGLYAALSVAILDQISKWAVLDFILAGARKVVVTDFFNVVLSWNRGVTFGVFNTPDSWQPYVLSAIAGAIVLYLLHWLWRVQTLPSALGIGMVMGGAMGNVIDRFRFGAVMDFLDFHFLGYHWYAFNVADSAIVGGVTLLVIEHFLETRKKDGKAP